MDSKLRFVKFFREFDSVQLANVGLPAKITFPGKISGHFESNTSFIKTKMKKINEAGTVFKFSFENSAHLYVMEVLLLFSVYLSEIKIYRKSTLSSVFSDWQTLGIKIILVEFFRENIDF